MPSLERPTICDLSEYEQAKQNRMLFEQLDNDEILMLYMRLIKGHQALKAPVQVKKSLPHAIGDTGLTILLLNEDLHPAPGTTPSLGTMPDGIWNAIKADDRFATVTAQGELVPVCDGVFTDYDDGLDMSLFEQMFAGAAANVSSDPRSFRI